MTRPTMFASDLDGTLLSPDHAISDRTHAAIEAAMDAGVEVVAATGRSHRTALPILRETRIRWAICSNGAVIWDRETDAVHHYRPIDGRLARHIIDHVRATIEGATIGWEVPEGYGFEVEYLETPPSLGRHGVPGDTPEPDGSGPVTKLFVNHPDIASAGEAMAILAPVLPDGVVASSSGGGYLELTADGVDKASGLQILADHLGHGVDGIWTFGDNHNDIAMLRWAGRGYAMGNAEPEVAAAASHRTVSNAEHGVAATIEAALAQSA